MQMPNYDEYVGEVFEGKAHGMGTYVYRGGKKDACYPAYFGDFRAGKGMDQVVFTTVQQ